MEEIRRIFTFPFEDRRWMEKILLGGLMVFIPILNFALFGYALRIMQDAMEGRPARLPEWNDFGAMWTRGAGPGVAIIVYMVPVYVLSFTWVGIIRLLALLSFDPTGTFPSAGLIGAVVLGVLFAFIGTPMIMAYYAALAVLAPFLAGMYVETSRFGSLFRVTAASRMVRENLSDTAITIALAFVAQTIGGLGYQLCFLPALFTMPYSYAVTALLFGRLNGKAVQKRGIQPIT